MDPGAGIVNFFCICKHKREHGVLRSPKQASTRKTRCIGSSATPMRLGYKSAAAAKIVFGVSEKIHRVVCRASGGSKVSEAFRKHVLPSVCCAQRPGSAPLLQRMECTAWISPAFCAILSCPSTENKLLKVASCDKTVHSPCSVHLLIHFRRRLVIGSSVHKSSISRLRVKRLRKPRRAQGDPLRTKCRVSSRKVGSDLPACLSMVGRRTLTRV